MRVQRKRTRGFKMPQNAVYVGRPTKWGNPYKVGVDGDLAAVIVKYREWLKEKLVAEPTFLDALKGKNLACWCPLNRPCHVDVLLEVLGEGGENGKA